MDRLTSFQELYAAVLQNPRVRVKKDVIHEIINSNISEINASVRMNMTISTKIHSSLFFEEVIRSKAFPFSELIALSLTSAPGAVAVIKNINCYHDELSTPEGLEALRTLIKPIARASQSVSTARSKKEIVSAFCTRTGLFTFARTADSEVRSMYESIYDETLEDTIVDYIISVYAQELVLSESDKQIVLPRVANSLKRNGKNSPASKKLDFFIHDRFYFRIFEPVKD